MFCGCCGEDSFQKIPCKCRKQIAEYFAALPRPHTVAIESVAFIAGCGRCSSRSWRSWCWPMRPRPALAGRRFKTDREDALNIADCWPPDDCPRATLRRWKCRAAGPHAAPQRLLAAARPVLCRVKSIMNANNRPGPARMQSDGLIRYLKAQGEKLPARHVAMLWQCVDQLGAHRAADDQAERTIGEVVRRETFRQVYGF